MGLWTIHKHDVHYKYKANLCSKATCFVIVCGVLTVIIPLLILCKNRGLWKTLEFYQEQPSVHFKNKMILILEGKQRKCVSPHSMQQRPKSAPLKLKRSVLNVNETTVKYITEKATPFNETQEFLNKSDATLPLHALGASEEEITTQWHDNQDNKENCLQTFTFLTWSTLFTYNHLNYNNLRSATLMSHEDDLNRDGKNDVLHFSVKIPVKDMEEIFSVKALLAFDYKLYTVIKLQMESLLYVDFNAALPGYAFTVIGDLTLKQHRPFKYQEKRQLYNMPVIEENSLDITKYDIGHILSSYSLRNVTTTLENSYKVWSPGNTSNDFLIKGTIIYPENQIKYIPGISDQLKWAWIQYFSFLFIFYLLFSAIKTFVLNNNMIPSIQSAPWKIHDA